MKIILSRKGFDSVNGGIVSPIFEDGMMVSMPIPSKNKDTFRVLSYKNLTYEKIIRDLGYKGDLHCHLDPDLDQTRRIASVEGWVPAFGQAGAAASYLKNIDVRVGDIFLFFGNFHHVKINKGRVKYVRNTGNFYLDNDLQVIWGYLQIGDILYSEAMQKKLWWHPHSCDGMAGSKTNVIFTAAKHLSLDPSMPGAGLLSFDEKRVLTKYGCSKGTWIKREVYDTKHIYGDRQNSAKNPKSCIYYAGIWQELGLKESTECIEWAKTILF